MNAEKVLLDRLKRMEIQKTFKDRMAALPVSNAHFCDEISIAYSTMSRLLSLNYAAGWKTINRVEDGLKKYNL